MRKPRPGAQVYTATEVAEKFDTSLDAWYAASEGLTTGRTAH